MRLREITWCLPVPDTTCDTPEIIFIYLLINYSNKQNVKFMQRYHDNTYQSLTFDFNNLFLPLPERRQNNQSEICSLSVALSEMFSWLGPVYTVRFAYAI